MKKSYVVLLLLVAGIVLALGGNFIPVAALSRALVIVGECTVVFSLFYLLLKIHKRDAMVMENKLLSKLIAQKESMPILSGFPVSTFLLCWTGFFGAAILVLEVLTLLR